MLLPPLADAVKRLSLAGALLDPKREFEALSSEPSVPPKIDFPAVAELSPVPAPAFD